jgi:hypothetical protein
LVASAKRKRDRENAMIAVKRITLVAALTVSSMPLWLALAQESPQDKTLQHFKGKVLPLADVLVKQGVKLDADAAPYGRALVTDDGKVYSLVKDPGARMFFQDKELLGRSMRLTGRLIPGSTLLQVINVHSYKDGKLHEVFYWCDICTIRRYEAGICECCGGPMERRESVSSEQ